MIEQYAEAQWDMNMSRKRTEADHGNFGSLVRGSYLAVRGMFYRIGGSAGTWWNGMLHSIWVFNTDGPHIKLAQLSPRSKIIRIDTSRFSPPLSPRTLEGTPCSIIASINMSRTVSDWLFEFA